MHRSFGLIVFIALITTTTIVYAQYESNPSPDQLDQVKQTRIANLSCTVDNDCGNHGYCRNNACQCYAGYITWANSDTCAYDQIEKLAAFLVSFFVGTLGIDWFVLSRGKGGYIAGGIFKLLMSCGCCVGFPCLFMGVRKNSTTWSSLGYAINGFVALGSSVWWFVDWIRILADGFPDGNGAPLKPW